MDMLATIRSTTKAKRAIETIGGMIRQLDDIIPSKKEATFYQMMYRHPETLLLHIAEAGTSSSTNTALSRADLNALIFHAAKDGQTDALRYLMEMTAFDPETRDEKGLTILDHAQKERHYDTVHFLISRTSPEGI